MERSVLVNEMMWEYDFTRAKAEEIVQSYEKQGKYDDLCEFIEARQDISTVIKEDV